MIRSIAFITLVGGIFSTSAVYAQTSEANLSMTRRQGETYEQLLDRGAKVAENGINQRFNRDKSLKWLKLSIFAESEGSMAPLMTVQVSRQDWLTQPDVQKWASVFPYSKTLLGFESPTVTRPAPAAAPATTPAPVPNPPGQPPANANNKPAANDPKKPAPIPIPIGAPYAPDEPLSPRLSTDQKLRGISPEGRDILRDKLIDSQSPVEVNQ
ncbi:MAG: hypothetical protein N5P05_000886 [Chroococcopsis gigantea SAG 12.99]|jgi:hypothetical protein|nr:hypothetical protein [Chlorogloea purpurea SAG 13.99]MDV2999280.1 hypothetical protein [Chroococcopsis gigantea SAG 12.99]